MLLRTAFKAVLFYFVLLYPLRFIGHIFGHEDKKLTIEQDDGFMKTMLYKIGHQEFLQEQGEFVKKQSGKLNR